MGRRLDLAAIRALAIDIDGTLLRGEQSLPGGADLFDFLRRRAIDFLVVSNNTTKTPARYQKKLAAAGIGIAVENILTAGTATAAWLRQTLPPGAPLYVIGEAALWQVLTEAGFSLVDDAAQPVAAVIVGGDSNLTYNKLKHAVLLLQRGAQFIGANPDLLIPAEEGLIPEAGTTLAALHAATGVTPIVIGKPERPLFAMALAQLGHPANQTAMLGDRAETDILGAQRAGLKTILVTTGVDTADSARAKGIEPDAVVGGLAELVDLWSK
jgi:4-nitrophenyl phosphatase